jgi:hypothetical protein
MPVSQRTDRHHRWLWVLTAWPLATSLITGCAHTGAVHHANMYMTNPDADVETEELMTETNMTRIR